MSGAPPTPSQCLPSPRSAAAPASSCNAPSSFSSTRPGRRVRCSPCAYIKECLRLQLCSTHLPTVPSCLLNCERPPRSLSCFAPTCPPRHFSPLFRAIWAQCFWADETSYYPLTKTQLPCVTINTINSSHTYHTKEESFVHNHMSMHVLAKSYIPINGTF